MTTETDNLDPFAAFRLDGRVAVITGGGSGMGRAMCELFAAVGAAVVVADINAATGAETVERIQAAGGRASFHHADIGRRDEVFALVAHAVDRFDGVDIMCNLGGPPTPFVELTDVSDDQLESVLATHLRSVLYGCQAAVPEMVRRGGGAILNMASTAADKPSAGNGLYTLAKSGVVTITQVLALELGPKHIRVNALAPGATLTNYSRRYFTAHDGTVDEARRTEWLGQMAAMSPLGITGTPEDQARLALFLVSDAARFVTGQTVRANGGWSMA